MVQASKADRITSWAVTRGEVSVSVVVARLVGEMPYHSFDDAFSLVVQVTVAAVAEVLAATEEMPGPLTSAIVKFQVVLADVPR